MLKKTFCFLLLFSLYTLSSQATETVTIEEKATLPLLSPAFSEQKTLKIRLSNGLEAYLVSDPTIDKSAAALTVRVGSWEDPKEVPGLAHFNEHMLFLGTKKYPNESEFDRFLSDHGGITNAFTSYDYTAYMFSVDNNAMEEALDRFSDFFIEPLFNPSGVARELQAIDQEYAKNVEDDDIRILQVQKELSLPEHPEHAFSMGNSLTLSHVSRETLIRWYQAHYSSDLMRLTVISDRPLDILKKWIEQDFSAIPRINKTPFTFDRASFDPAMRGKMVYIEPKKNLRRLTIMWEFPESIFGMLESKPDNLICHVLGHEGKKSLLEKLKREKLADTIICEASRLGGKNYLFALEIGLTDVGVRKVDTVVERIFQTIAAFKKNGVPRYLFDEIRKMQTIAYQYPSRENIFLSVMKHASWMAEESMDTYPLHNQVIQTFDPDAVMTLLTGLTPESASYLLTAPSSLTGITPDRKEKWLGVPYAIRPIASEIMERWKNAQPIKEIDLPSANPFLPANLTLVPMTKGPAENIVPIPSAIHKDAHGLFYYAPDPLYRTPTISWIFQIKSPLIHAGNPDSVALTDIYINYLKEILNVYSYDATLAELVYEVKRLDFGIELRIQGFSDKASILLAEILKNITLPDPQEIPFKRIKPILLREYENAGKESPLKQATEELKQALYQDYSSDKSKAAALRKISFDRFKDFTLQLFTKTYTEGILYGNLTEAEAKDTAKLVLSSLKSAPYPPEEQLKQKVISLPVDKGPFYYEKKTDASGNALILAIEIGPLTAKARAAQQILSEAMSEPFFNALRTKQQTGYIVSNTAEEMEKELFSLFYVQSNTHEGRDLLARFELFIEGYLQEMATGEFPIERFEKIKAALLTTLRNPAKNVNEMSELLNRLAFKYDGEFDWIRQRISALQDLSYDDFNPLARQFLGKRNKQRLAIIMKGVLPEDRVFDYKRLSNLNELNKM